MKPNDGCSRLRRVVLVHATIWLTGCVTGASDVGGIAACPPVVKYSREFQARAAEELALLPEESAIAEMLADYAVMRDVSQIWWKFSGRVLRAIGFVLSMDIPLPSQLSCS